MIWKKILTFLSKPLVSVGVGFAGIIIVIAHLIALPLEPVEPVFSFGVILGMSLNCAMAGEFGLIFQHFDHVSCADRVTKQAASEEAWYKSQAALNNKILSILEAEWTDVPPSSDF